MIIVDEALAKREEQKKPIRVGMIGAGFMARGIAMQILNVVPGMRLAAIFNRNPDKAAQCYRDAGVSEIARPKTLSQLEDAVSRDIPAVCEDPMFICEADGIDAVIEVTGAVEFGAKIALRAIDHKKHVILMNAELDGTIGPILKAKADKAGVVITNADGDQPGVEMNLYRFVRGIGVEPLLCGNIKGLHDPYRNPKTQEEFAKKWGQNPAMVTSFADGSKISFEQAIVANATGMKVAKRGMHGHTVETGTSIKEAAQMFSAEELLNGNGLVDYIVGAEPAPGVFVLGTHDDDAQKHYLNLYKLGEGPIYCFYTPYHLCHFEVPSTVARAVLFHDATIAPLGRPMVDVVATAKISLQEGQMLDGIGHFMTYGLCENADAAAEERLLPIGLAEGCRLKKAIAKDAVITYDDVIIPEGRLCDKLRAEQNAYFQ